MPAESRTHRNTSGRSYGWPWFLLVALLVTLAWCTTYNRWTLESWKTPLSYASDATWVLTYAKALATGEIAPVLPKHPTSFGAPFAANWNDYPTIDEGFSGACALLVRLFGLFPGVNLAVLLAQVLAAASFYFVCRYLQYNRYLSIAGAVLFSCSHYAFARSLAHISLTSYWHVPLGLLVIWWCVGKRVVIREKRKVLFCVVIAIMYGIQNAYYTGLFLQFLGWAAVICLFRRRGWAAVSMPLLLLGITIATFALMNFDTFSSRFVHGPNPAAVSRSYSGVELYALKPLELLLPAGHRITALQTWTNETYFKQALFIGEGGSPYLGFVAIAGLGLLLWKTLRGLAKQNIREIPSHLWFVVWICAYSTVGGVNGFIGLFGLVLFRCSDRYSIVIQALLLLLVVRELTRVTRRWRWQAVAPLAGVLILVGLWDQLPRFTSTQAITALREFVLSDQKVTSMMEAKLPRQAMVFEMPVAGFPEVPPIHGMHDYEHFRPYLHSHSLRFSYGSNKGRPREAWQYEAEGLGASALVNLLEGYGFSAILINRRGYADQASSLLTDFRNAGRANVLVETPDFFCLSLNPSPRPGLPPEFFNGWFGLEGTFQGDWRWSGGDGTIILHNTEPPVKSVRLTFGLGTLKSRRVSMIAGGRTVYETSLSPDRPSAVDLNLTLAPGKNELRLVTDVPSDFPPNGDPRKVAFNLTNFRVSY